MRKLLFILFRILLGTFFILYGLKGLSEVNSNKNILTYSVDQFEKEVLLPYELSLNLNVIKQHPIEILYFENISIIYGGFLMIFGFGLSKAFVATGLLVEFILLNNIWIFKNEKHMIHFSLLLSLLGGVYSIK